MTEMYRFVLGQNPCDICTPMANVYPYAPSVPVHPNCDCTVIPIPGSGNCTTELRNVESTEVQFSDTAIHTADLFNDSTHPVTASVLIRMGVITESWEDSRLPAAIGWDPPTGMRPAEFELPAESAGEIRVTTELEITQVMVKAELWEVCRRAPAPGATTGHTLHERKLADVGGGATAVTDILDVESEYIFDSGYEDDDEVPV